MPDRLSPLDASFVYFEAADTPMHVGSVAIFTESADGFDYDRLVALIEDRIAFVPRYRQRIQPVLGRLARPVWVDDADFDLTYHVRRSALPRPGGDEQLYELVSRVMSRPLDRDRPLWEMYLVEGLAGGRFAVLSKTHHAVVDGVTAVDIGQVILDDTAEPCDSGPDLWQPKPGPSRVDLVVGAITETVRRPSTAVEQVRAGLSGVEHGAQRILGNLGGLAATARAAARPAPSGPLNVDIGSHRRFATVDASLDDFRRIRVTHGGTINDVVLATLAGALRVWLLTRGEAVRPDTSMRALVPVSVRPTVDGGMAAVGNRVASYLVDLPVGEANPVVRLQRVSFAMRAHSDTGQAVGARALAELAGFAPATLHALGARVASGLSRRLFNLIVTNVPGPQVALYAAGARLAASYPVVPLARGQGLSVGVTSYDGAVHYGLNADRDALPDLHVLAQCVTDAVDELLDTVEA
jgi:diacylglycerol O-acyltransferase / wax synthase